MHQYPVQRVLSYLKVCFRDPPVVVLRPPNRVPNDVLTPSYTLRNVSPLALEFQVKYQT